jgi:hypothetical protein
MRMLETGAGAGQDSVFFAGHGLDVVATDISPAMVAVPGQGPGRTGDGLQPAGLPGRVLRCRARHELPPARAECRAARRTAVHRPCSAAGRAVLFPGVYGDSERMEECPAEADDHVPARFLSWRPDDQIVRFASGSFDIVDFPIAQEDAQYRFQSLTLRRQLDLGARPIRLPRSESTLLPGRSGTTVLAGLTAASSVCH